MKLRNLFFRNKEQQEVQEVILWHVRWSSRYGQYCGDVKPEVKAFTCKEDAKAFKAALQDAYSLLKHTSGVTVTISEGE